MKNQSNISVLSSVQNGTQTAQATPQADRDAWDALLDTPESREFLDEMKKQSLQELEADDEGSLTEF